MKQLGTIPTLHSEDEDDEDEDLDDSVSQTQGDVHPQTTDSEDRAGPSSRPTSSQSGIPAAAPKGKASRKRRQLDNAILKLVEKASGTQKMQEQLDAAILSSNNAQATWANWMGTELQSLPENLWTSFQKESFALVMRYKETAESTKIVVVEDVQVQQ